MARASSLDSFKSSKPTSARYSCGRSWGASGSGTVSLMSSKRVAPGAGRVTPDVQPPLQGLEGQRDVVLVRQARRREALADALTVGPQGARLLGALGSRRVEREAQLRLEPRVARRALGLEQHVVRVRNREGRRQLAVPHQ